MSLYSITLPSKTIFDEEVKSILKRPGYKHLSGGLPDFINGIKEKIKEWFLGFIEKTFSNLSNAPAISEGLSTAFMIIGLLFIVSIIIFIIVRVSKTFDKKARVKEILGETIHEGVTPNSLRVRGADFLKNGNFREAIRYDFIAVLLLMHEKNILYLDETKTGEEIYNFLKKNKFEMAPSFKRLVKIFNSSWYGHKQTEQDTYNEWDSVISLIWNGVISYEEKSQ